MASTTVWVRKELATAVANATGLDRKAALRAVEAVISGIATHVAAGDRVVLRDFGTFVAVERAERKVRDFRTGKWRMAPAKRAVRFKASTALKRAVNAGGRD